LLSNLKSLSLHIIKLIINFLTSLFHNFEYKKTVSTLVVYL